MRFPLLLLAVGAVLWFGFGAPVPVVTHKPLEPSDEVGSFAAVQSESSVYKVQQAIANGRVSQDPARRKLRQAVIRAGERLRSWPCNEGVRQEFVAAVVPYLEALMDGPAEYVTIDGKQHNASRVFEEEPYRFIEQAVYARQIRHGDIPRRLAQQSGIGLPRDPNAPNLSDEFPSLAGDFGGCDS